MRRPVVVVGLLGLMSLSAHGQAPKLTPTPPTNPNQQLLEAINRNTEAIARLAEQVKVLGERQDNSAKELRAAIDKTTSATEAVTQAVKGIPPARRSVVIEDFNIESLVALTGDDKASLTCQTGNTNLGPVAPPHWGPRCGPVGLAGYFCSSLGFKYGFPLKSRSEPGVNGNAGAVYVEKFVCTD